jgi:hypothetical protein
MGGVRGVLKGQLEQHSMLIVETPVRHVALHTACCCHPFRHDDSVMHAS